MFSRDDVELGLHHFRVHKLRMVLVTVGIAAAVGTLVMLLTIADAMRRDRVAYFRESGARLAEVVLLDARGVEEERVETYEYGPTASERYDILPYLPVRDWKDGERIRARLPEHIEAISPVIHDAAQVPSISCGPMIGDIRVYGVTAEFFRCINPQPLAGRVLDEADVAESRRVAVVPAAILAEYHAFRLGGYDKLDAAYGKGYRDKDLPMDLLEEGKAFKIGGFPYQVVGILPKDRPVLEAFLRYNWCCFVPFPAERELTGKGATNRFVFYPKTSAQEAFAAMQPILREMYPGATPVLHSVEQWANEERRSLSAITMSLAAVGVITLLVANIGLANTMMASARERRLEVALRKAIGASSVDIRNQFLVETLMVALVGVTSGLLLGLVLTAVAAATQNVFLIPLLEKMRNYTAFGAGGWNMELRPWTVNWPTAFTVGIIASAVSLGMALLAGVLPALEAAALHPVECLRRRWGGLSGESRRRHRWMVKVLGPFADDPERTWLAVSSVAVGVALVVVLASVGEHSQQQTINWANRVAADVIAFQVGPPGTPYTLPPFDEPLFGILTKECPHVKSLWYQAQPASWAGYSVQSSSVTITDQNFLKHRMFSVTAVPAGSVSFFPQRAVLFGEDFSEADVRDRNPVCLLNEHAAEVLFPGQSALGQPLLVQGTTFRVKGILRQGNPYDLRPWGRIEIPYSFHRTVLQTEGATSILAHTTDPERARDEMMAVYRANRNREVHPSFHFSMIGEEQADARRQVWAQVAAMLALAAGTMFVGGVAMANTMLLGVAARTHELAVYRALGATRHRILGKMIWEAFLLSLAGGILGLAMGVIGTQYGLVLVTEFWQQDEMWAAGTSVRWSVVALAFGVVVGVLGALGPALKACYIRPVEALRSE